MPLELDHDAERMVREKYAEFAELGYVPFAEMNDSRLKMAMLPRGAEAVVNPAGGAPGVLVRQGDDRHRLAARRARGADGDRR